MTPVALSPEHIKRRLDTTPIHLRPIFEAVADFGCGFCVVEQYSGRFSLPRLDIPSIVFLGDDADTALGPAAFHKKSVRRLIDTVGLALVVAAEPVLQPYATAATIAAVIRKSVLIVETRPEQEIQWVHLLQEARPSLRIILCTTNEGRA